ncbi:MAG: DUF5063 domain-containing protein [Candidatus Polarisedimenticolaceae bacterium]|nr:DUF5063 domain-containing protein [Candidatus Polarisedimenticolaceae bacterium]
MNRHLNEIEGEAALFCELIESIDVADSSWLRKISDVLPRLHVAVAALGVAPDSISSGGDTDLDVRFELYTNLRRVIGCRDSYWMEFDLMEEGSASGSLADDLTDIYYELKKNLPYIDNPISQVVDDLRSGFKFHWGQHLVDAERHLYVLGSRNQL